MFGKKIISEREYNDLKRTEANAEDKVNFTIEKLAERNKDCDSLRQQLNDQMKECRKLQQANEKLREFKRDTLEALANIDLGSFRLKVCVSKCDHCKHEPTDCRKYTFGSHTFCVITKP